MLFWTLGNAELRCINIYKGVKRVSHCVRGQPVGTRSDLRANETIANQHHPYSDIRYTDVAGYHVDLRDQHDCLVFTL